MKTTFSLACAALGLIAAACSGTTLIGEGAESDGGSGGSKVEDGVAEGGGSDSPSAAEMGGSTASAGAETGGDPAPAGAGQGGTSTTGGRPPLPCEVLQDAGHRCVAAHSTVRVVVPGYTGNLYQVRREDGTTEEIGTVDGYADADEQDQFCFLSSCVITIVYDQSPMGNDVTLAPPGSSKPTPANPVNADALAVTVDGHEAYGMLFLPGQGYRKLLGNGTAVGDEPQTVYMVSSQHDLINGCCLDYGNGSTTANNNGNGSAEAVYLGMGVIWGTGSGTGPWVMADLENGLYPGWENGQFYDISTNTPVAHDFVTAVLVGDTADKNEGRGRFALYGGNAAAGSLATMYDGIRPSKPGYVPMHKEGSVILGVASDNSDYDGGRFYEGVIANGAATKETVDALQAAIVAARYGK